MRRWWGVLLALLICAAVRAQGGQDAASLAPRTLDSMDDPAAWKVVTPEGVTLSVHKDDTQGVPSCLRLDYEFVSGGGYCIIQRDLPLTLPPNYEFAFHLRGEGPDNNLEFKLLDEKGDSVWWINRRALAWPHEWSRILNKKRKFEFAWGPSAGAPLTAISKVEFAIASSSGGKGSIWLDNLEFRELPVTATGAQAQPTAKATTSIEEHPASLALDGDPATFWKSEPVSAHGKYPAITIDLGAPREYGGIEILWAQPATGFVDVLANNGSDPQRPLAMGHRVTGNKTWILCPDAESRYITISQWKEGERGPLAAGAASDNVSVEDMAIAEVRVKPAGYSESPNAAWSELAQAAVRGRYPKYLLNEASYWTVVGAEESSEEALINEEGQVEVGKRLFSVEPFLILRNGAAPRAITWADGTNTQTLERGNLPIPTVSRTSEGVTLATTAWTESNYGVPWLMLRYRITNTGASPWRGDLALALRPFQVNPPWQRLNFEGGIAPISAIETMTQPDGPWLGKTVGARVHTSRGTRDVLALSGADDFLIQDLDTGDVVQALLDALPPKPLADSNPDVPLTGAYIIHLDLAPGASKDCIFGVPMRDSAQSPLLPVTPHESRESAEKSIAWVAGEWARRVSTPKLAVPSTDQWLADAFAAQLAYILINRDGPALQPGSRSYERSWARDGSLTSAALLACGHEKEARAWVDWFATHQFENGKIPCVVDTRGADPVAEHDSHGEYIWAVAHYYKFTKDSEFLARHWPHVQKAVGYIVALRNERMTPEYEHATDPLRRAMYGLMPESISHEGYSAKPMHSYWDDFFTLLGLKEAAYLASQVGDDDATNVYAKLAAHFRQCLYASMRRVFEAKGIDYIPGCVELGDFDATSTTISMFPCDEQDQVPQAQLARTFEKYWEFASARMQADAAHAIDGPGVWEAYTPYEWRCVGSLVRLNQRERAYQLLQWFRAHQRPQGWHHWAEVVWREPKTTKFIGDMPHTWVGSDFLNSVLSMFVYERSEGLTLLAGVPKAWVESGERVAIEGVRTSAGTLSVSLQRKEDGVHVRVEGQIAMPDAGITIKQPPGTKGGDAVTGVLPFEAVWKLE